MPFPVLRRLDMKLVRKQGTEQSPVRAALNAATMDRRTFL
jgi:hypothetical protein